VTFQRKLLFGIVCLLLLPVFTSTIIAQTLQDHTKSIRAAIDAGDLKAALAELRATQQSDAAGFTLNNFDYLLARVLEMAGDDVASASGYQPVVARRSLLSQYALWHLAQNARASGDLVLERERLRQLVFIAPSSLLCDAATMRTAESFFESRDYNNAVLTLRGLTESKNVPLARQALVLAGNASLRASDAAGARAAFTRLITKLPDPSRPDDFALEAARGLDSLDGADSAQVSDADHLQRAAIYQFNRDFEGARHHYLAIVEHQPQGAAAPESLYQIGRGLYQEEKYDEALKYLQRAANSNGTGSSPRDALALIAGTYSRQKRTDDAIAAYEQLIDRFPAAPNPERPYLNIIDVLRDAGRDDEALRWVKRTREQFKEQIGGTLALFAEAKIHIAQSAWSVAATDLDELRQVQDLGGARVPGGTTASEVAFLRALALEQTGRAQEAIDSYLLIPEGRNEYYGFRADERLRAMQLNLKTVSLEKARTEFKETVANGLNGGGEPERVRRAAHTLLRLEDDPVKRKQILDVARAAYAKLPIYTFPTFNLLPLGRQNILNESQAKNDAAPSHQAFADELLFLGLYDEGMPELVAARAASTTAQGKTLTDLDYTLAVNSLRGDLPYPAVRFAEQVWRSIPSDYLVELAPRQMLEMLYPAPYRTSLLKQATPRKLDPRFVLSIARQETRFQAEAKSVAAARGLMQFIAATATDTATQLGRHDFRQDDLYNPDTAIEFGSQYLASLFQRFPNQPQAVAASYNGGADNVARWIARSHSNDADRYVAEIGFSQSKDYVLRVLANFWVYQKLYDSNLQPQQ
jgi:soluble lytic murein transglycosylase